MEYKCIVTKEGIAGVVGRRCVSFGGRWGCENRGGCRYHDSVESKHVAPYHIICLYYHCCVWRNFTHLYFTNTSGWNTSSSNILRTCLQTFAVYVLFAKLQATYYNYDKYLAQSCFLTQNLILIIRNRHTVSVTKFHISLIHVYSVYNLTQLISRLACLSPKESKCSKCRTIMFK